MSSKNEICVLVLATKKNKAIKDELVSFLTSKGERVCILGDRFGANIWEDLEFCINAASKVIIVSTDDLQIDTALCYKISIVLVKFNHYDIINLVANLSQNVIIQLTSVNTICLDTSSWKDNLINEINRKHSNIINYYSSVRGVSFCELPSRTIYNSVQECNRNYSDNLFYDIYGVRFTAKDVKTSLSPVVAVEFQSFVKSITRNQFGKLREVCDTFKTFHKNEVRMRLVFGKSNISEENDTLIQLAELFGSVCSLETLGSLWLQKTEDSPSWRLCMTIEGCMDAYMEQLLFRFNSSIRTALHTKYKVSFEQYLDIAKRKRTFDGRWDETKNPNAEKMAESGFFLDTKGVPVCFCCGCWFHFWNRLTPEFDVTSWHALVVPMCRIVQRNHVSKTLIVDIFKDFENKEVRTKSLINSAVRPDVAMETLEDLADSGFFYMGLQDCVICFSCFRVLCLVDIGRQNVWSLHAGISPTCQHVINIKGRQFVKDIQSARSQASSSRSMTFFLKRYDTQREWHASSIHIPSFLLSYNCPQQ